MSDVIDRLKEGLAEAQKRHAEVAKRWQMVQAEWTAVNTEVSGYQKVIELETRRELERAAVAPQSQGPATRAEQQLEQETNKTQVVRNALAEHPGLTPAQIWGAVKGQINRRTYVYSILKRLKDRKQVIERRGKYYMPEVPKAAVEGGDQLPLQ